MKPADFLIGVLDFFAVLLPGSMATWLVTRYVPPDELSRYLSFGTGQPDSVSLWVAFLLSSYTLGHFVFMVGSYLDPSYDRWRRLTKPTSSDATYTAANELRKNSLAEGPFTTLKWAKSYVQIHAPEARVEIDRFDANSKFFRSLVVIWLVVAAHFFLHERAPGMGVVSLVMGAMSYQRFVDQRWKMTELSYATAVILHATKLAPRSSEGSQSGQERLPSRQSPSGTL